MQLDPEYLSATGGAQQELVLLHGWGSNREIWRPLLACLRPWANITLLDLPGCAPGLACGEEIEWADVLEAVLAAAPERAVYLGWSIGGQLALALAAHLPQRVAAVVTLCSNPRFVAEPGWPGMEPAVFASFRAACLAQPATTLRRFDSLQAQGTARPRALLRQLQAQRRQAPGEELMTGLDWLAQLDQRQLLQTLPQPQLHLLAERDGLVPAELQQVLDGLLRGAKNARVQVLGGACHLAPLARATELAAATHEFLAAAGLLGKVSLQGAGPDKKDVASSFSRAAPSYDSVAQLQRDVGARLLARLPAGDPAAAVVLDLGCGTGYFRAGLTARYGSATYIGLDLAPGMVEYARGRAADEGLWLVGDAEALPLAPGSVDLVFSSLAIQWCQRPELFFTELARALKPGGRCLFT
ncbi:MAG: alpha/beta fold hydrolase, partial [Halioglobus sp.]|nr:alpha/beta fold hydrolase [Halioglobus sp.]